jgi:hypothetical protein
MNVHVGRERRQINMSAPETPPLNLWVSITNALFGAPSVSS